MIRRALVISFILLCSQMYGQYRVALPTQPFRLSDKSHFSLPEEQRVVISAGEFIEWMHYDLSDSPIVLAVWADDRERRMTNAGVSPERTWGENLNAMRQWAGPYSILFHPNFAEIAWANSQRANKIRKNFRNIVPPIYFQAPDKKEFPSLWSEISGIRIQCDPALFASNQKPSSSPYTTPYTTGYAGYGSSSTAPTKYYYTCKEFLSTDWRPIKEFMAILAADFDGAAWQENKQWVLGKYNDAPDEGTKINALISRILVDTYGPGVDEDTMRLLVGFGEKAMPRLIKEFEHANGYTLRNLTDVLAEIPSKQRDEVFFRRLESLNSQEQNFISNYAIRVIIDTLVRRKVDKVVPVLEKILANRPIGDEVRIRAVVALNLFNKPVAPRPVDAFLVLHPSLHDDLLKAPVRNTFPVFIATLDQTFQPSSTTLQLRNVSHVVSEDLVLINKDETLSNSRCSSETLRMLKSIQPTDSVDLFSGSFPSGRGNWSVEIRSVTDSTALIFAKFLRGPLWGAGYLGRAEKRHARWIIVDWQMLWVN